MNIRNSFEEKVLELVKLVFHICWNIFWGCFEGIWKEESLAEQGYYMVVELVDDRKNINTSELMFCGNGE